MITDYAQMSVKVRSLLADEQTKNAIDKALSTYPLYEGKKNYDLIPTRKQLNERLLNHYRSREIGFETVGRFVEELEITMCEIMPYYNELLKTVEIMADLENPFDNVDVTETFEEERTEKTETGGTTTANASSKVEAEGGSNDTRKNKFSDTPQNHVDNIDKYLTQYTEENNNTTSTSKTEGTDESESTTSATSDVTGTIKHTFTKKGNQGVNTYAHDMIEFRATIRDIVNEIVNDYRIQNLFMLIW